MCAVAGLVSNAVLPVTSISTYARELLFFAFPSTMVISGGYLACRLTTLPVIVRKTWPGEIWLEALYVVLWFVLYCVALALSGKLGFSEVSVF